VAQIGLKGDKNYTPQQISTNGTGLKNLDDSTTASSRASSQGRSEEL